MKREYIEESAREESGRLRKNNMQNDIDISKKFEDAKNRIDEFVFAQKQILKYRFAPPDGRAKRREKKKNIKT